MSNDAESYCQFHPDGTFECPLGTLTAEEVELARENFTKFDRDGDGSISRADFAAAMAQHDPKWASPAKSEQLDAMYATVDTDGDGIVRFTEFAVMRCRKKMTAQANETPRGWVTARGPTLPPQSCPPQQQQQYVMPPQQPQPHPCAGALPAFGSTPPALPAFGATPPSYGGGGYGYGAAAGYGAGVYGGAAAGPYGASAFGYDDGGIAMGGQLVAPGPFSPRSPRVPMSPRAPGQAPSFLGALSQAYFTLHPHGDGWLPTPRLAELITETAQAYRVPLRAQQAAALCEQADAGDGWANLHQLLAMRSFTTFVEQLCTYAATYPAQQSPRGGSCPLERGTRTGHAFATR